MNIDTSKIKEIYGESILNNLSDEYIYDDLNSKDEDQKSSSRSRRSKGKDMISDVMKNNVRKAMTNGSIYEETDDIFYGVSRENIAKIFCNPDACEEPMSKEMLDRLITKFEADGYKFKYETDKAFKQAKLADPFED